MTHIFIVSGNDTTDVVEQLNALLGEDLQQDVQYAELEDECSRLEDETESLTGKLARSQDLFRLATRQIDELRGEVEELRTQNTRLREQGGHADTTNLDLHAQNDRLRRTVNKLLTQQSRLEAERNSLKNQLARRPTHDAIDRLVAECQRLKRERDEEKAHGDKAMEAMNNTMRHLEQHLLQRLHIMGSCNVAYDEQLGVYVDIPNLKRQAS